MRIAAAEVARPTLDDVFLALTGRSLRETGADPTDPTDPTGATDPAHGSATPELNDTSTSELQGQHS